MHVVPSSHSEQHQQHYLCAFGCLCDVVAVIAAVRLEEKEVKMALSGGAIVVVVFRYYHMIAQQLGIKSTTYSTSTLCATNAIVTTCKRCDPVMFGKPPGILRCKNKQLGIVIAIVNSNTHSISSLVSQLKTTME